MQKPQFPGLLAFNILGRIALRLAKYRQELTESGQLTSADKYVLEMAEQSLSLAYDESERTLEQKTGIHALLNLLCEGIQLQPHISFVTLKKDQLEEILAQLRATGESEVTIYDMGQKISASVSIERFPGTHHIEIFSDKSAALQNS